MSKIILDLCGGTGAWSRPYVDAGYHVIVVDLNVKSNYGYASPELVGVDVRKWSLMADTHPSFNVHGVLAAPPCTHFASSGARWWAGKGDGPYLDGISIVDACMRLILISKPKWWALENPVGRLINVIGHWDHVFNPCDYGDPYTKKTCLWGNFNMPEKTPVYPAGGSKMHTMPPSKERARLRSVTPSGFAKAFFEANP